MEPVQEKKGKVEPVQEKENKLFVNRDWSWLSFNYRVFQEAKDPRVPLLEQLKFMAIYSANLDEYFRVRMAGLRHLIRLKQKHIQKLDFNPSELLRRILDKIDQHQEEFGAVFTKQLIPKLKKEGILLINETGLTTAQKIYVNGYYKEQIKPLLKPIVSGIKEEKTFLDDKGIYFVVDLRVPGNDEQDFTYGLVQIPSVKLPRFKVLPKMNKKRYIMFLDDILRMYIEDLFPGFEIKGCYSVKVTRDAELYLEEEFEGTLRDKIRKSLRKRKTGRPTRFLYDTAMPEEFLDKMRQAFDIKRQDIVPGGRYHNFSDFFDFPNPGRADLSYPPLVHLKHSAFEGKANYFSVISKSDVLLHFPYQRYDYIFELLQQAAEDRYVRSIKISLYRVADDSQVAKALIRAAQKGKKVTVFVELKARFDEESNLHWGQELENAGAKVLYSFEDLKVHTKLFLITRTERGKQKRYAYLGSGNFNEKTAKIYCDFAILTADQQIGAEVDKVFTFLENPKKKQQYKHLLVAPNHMRDRFTELIDQEITNAKAGKKAAMVLKMNSLEDRKMILKLYEASEAGVKISMIIRGICCLKPKTKGLSDNIRISSIVDQFLEHARVYIFHNNGNEKVYVASADWMKRNLSGRVEVAFPILNPKLKDEILDVIKLQLKDNMKARKINKRQNNPYKKSVARKRIRAQADTYKYLEGKH